MATDVSLTREQRAESVADALHSNALEGLVCTPGTLVDLGEYVAGTIDVEEALARVKRRYGRA